MNIKEKFILRRLKDISKELRHNRYSAVKVNAAAKELETIYNEISKILKEERRNEDEIL